MTKTCPKRGSIAEYNAYYGRITCTSCEWESELVKDTQSQSKKVCPWNNFTDCYQDSCPFYGVVKVTDTSTGTSNCPKYIYGCRRILKELENTYPK